MAETRGISNVGLTIIVILVLLFLAGLGYATTLPPPVPTRSQTVTESPPAPSPSPSPPVTAAPAQSSADIVNPTSLTISVRDDKTPWAFMAEEKANPTIQLKKGEKVTLKFTNTGAIPHDLTVEGLEVADIPPGHTPGGEPGQTLDPDQEGEVIFTPNEAGTFTYFCSVPGHKELGMVGKIIVE